MPFCIIPATSGKVTMMPRSKFSLKLGFLKLELHRQLTTEVVGR
jgi:hypothetical protein